MWFNDIEINQRYSLVSYPAGGVAPTRHALAVHACRERHKRPRSEVGEDDEGSQPRQIPSEILPKNKAFLYAWAAVFSLMGSALIVLALLGITPAGISFP